MRPETSTKRKEARALSGLSLSFLSFGGVTTSLLYMSIHRARLRPLIIPDRKNVNFDPPSHLTGGHLSPDLQPNTPPTFPTEPPSHHGPASQIGEYLLLDLVDSNGPVHVYKSLHVVSHQEFTCKVGSLFHNSMYTVDLA